MAICGRCSTTYSGFTCPNCVQIRAIEKQTSAQAKFHKSQMKAGSGGSGGGFFSNIFALTVGLVQLFAALSVLMFKIYAFIFKKSAHIAVKGVKAAKDYNDENPNSLLTRKWSERSKGYKIFYISAITLSVTFFLIVISASNDDAKTRVSLDKEAVAAGFESYSEKVAAENAGFKDKASYVKHLAEIEDKKKAAELPTQEPMRIEAARASEAVNDPVLTDGQTLSQWKKMCTTYSNAITACSTNANNYQELTSCMNGRMGGLELKQPLTDCDGNNPPSYLFPSN